MAHPRSCSQRFYNRLSAIGSFVADFISPLKAIPKAISEVESVKDFSQGLMQITRIPSLLRDKVRSKKTRVLVYNSMISNIPKYLMIAMMYRRLVDIVYEDTPNFLHYAVAGLDTAIVATFFLRLFVRRLVENALYTASLPRAISNDTAEHLIKTVSTLLAREVAKTLSNIFSMQNNSEQIYRQLVSEMATIFGKIFLGKNISESSFSQVQTELVGLFLKTIMQLEELKVSGHIAKDVAALLAKSIVEEFSGAVLLRPRKEIDAALEKTQRTLTKSLSSVLIGKRASDIAAQSIKGIIDTREQVQSFLPAKHTLPCQCNLPRVVQASLSSPLYFLGNTLLTYTPNMLEYAGVSSKYFIYGKGVGLMLRALLNGQSLIEAKLSAAGLCSRHRYMMGVRNKARLIGQGAAYLLNVELAAFLFKLYSGVDNAFTRDAIASFLLLLHLIPTYAFNEPLPGKKPRPLDIFLPSRKAIFWVSKGLKAWILPDFKNKDAREDCIRNIRNVLGANWFHSGIYLLLGSSQFIPFDEARQLLREKTVKQQIKLLHPKLKSIKEVKGWEQSVRQQIDDVIERQEEQEARTLEHVNRDVPILQRARKTLLDQTKSLLVERDKIKNKKNPIRVLCENNSVRLFIKLFEKDIKSGIAYAEFLRRLSPWLVTPLSILPVQGSIISMIEVPLHLLNEASLEEIFREINAQLIEIDADNLNAPPVEAKYFNNPVIVSLPKEIPALPAITYVAPANEEKPIALPEPKQLDSTALVKKLMVPSLPTQPVAAPSPKPSRREINSTLYSFDSACCVPVLDFSQSNVPLRVEEPEDPKEGWEEVAPVKPVLKVVATPPTRATKPKASKPSWLSGAYRYGVLGVGNALGLRPRTGKEEEAYELRSWR